MSIASIVIAQSLTEWMNDKVAEVQAVVVAVVALLAVLFIVTTWWTTKALVPTLTAMLLAGGVLWAVSNVDWFEGRIGEEVGLAPAVTVAAAAAVQPDPAAVLAVEGARHG